VSRTIQKNSLVRAPTKVEAIVGFLGSVLLVLVGIAILAFLILHWDRARNDARAATVVFVVGAVIAGLGLYFLLRIILTPAQKASKRAAHIATVVLAMCALLVAIGRIVNLLWRP
jgi:hypothetical protein